MNASYILNLSIYDYLVYIHATLPVLIIVIALPSISIIIVMKSLSTKSFNYLYYMIFSYTLLILPAPRI